MPTVLHIRQGRFAVSVPLEVTEKQIASLDDRQLTVVLKALVEAELIKAGIGLSAAEIPLTLDIADDGEDGIVTWEGGPSRAGRISQRRTIFQVKSGKPEPKECAEDVLAKDGNIKPRIETNRIAGGTYVLFVSQSCTGKMKDAREAAIRNAFASAIGIDAAARASIKVFSGDVIASWVNEFYGVSLRTQALCGNAIPENYMSWDQWSQQRSMSQSEFQADNTAAAYISTLREALAKPRASVRLIGLSGRGKTRLALEALRSPSDASKGIGLASSVIYIDDPQPSELLSHTQALRNRSRSGILVADNCSLELHAKLVDIIDHPESNLSLLTIDLDLTKDASATGLLEVGKASLAVLSGIIRAAYPGMAPQDVAFLASYSDGFPRIASQLIVSGVNEDIGLHPLTEPLLTRRLLWGRDDVDPEKLRTIEACALFHHIGFIGSAAAHRQYVARRICGQTDEAFYRNVVYFRRKGLIDQLGPYIRVSPLPLAIRLADQWFENSPIEMREALLTDAEMPDALAEALAQQYSNLDKVERANEIVRRLVRTGGPFGSLEALNSKRGSRFIRSFVDVEPDACLDLLINVLRPKSTEQLRNFSVGRRDIVWALERLVYDVSRFVRSARLLLSLAAAENETWANNATAQFLHLFQAELAGTAAPPELRLKLVDDVLGEGNPTLTMLAIRGLGVAISTRHFTRTVGPEQQGSRRYDDWAPTTGHEVIAYFNACLDRLVLLARRRDDIGATARKALADGMRTQVFVGNLDGIDAALRSVRETYRDLWPEALAEAADAARYEGRRLTPRDRARVLAWQDLFSPNDLVDRLNVYVRNAPPGWGLPEEDVTADFTHTGFDALVSDVAGDPTTWPLVIQTLSSGDQARTFEYGERLGEASDPDALLTLALKFAQSSDGSDLNPSLIAGILASIKAQDNDRYAEALNQVLSVRNLVQHSVWINAAAGLLPGDLARLGRLLEKGLVSQHSFRIFTYGRTLLNQRPSDIAAVFSRVLASGVEGGWTTIGVLGMYLKDDAVWSACREVLANAVLSSDIALSTNVSTMDRYAYGKACERLLQELSARESLIVGLANHAVKLCSLRDMNTNSYDMIRPIVFRLLKEHADATWPIIRDAITLADGLTQFHWTELLSDSIPMQEPRSAFDLLSPDLVLAWVRSAPNIALHVVLRELPLFRLDANGTMRVHPLVERFVDEFGDNEEMLSTITANLHSFRFTGSAESLFRARAAFTERFLNHRRASVAAWAARGKSVFAELAEAERLRQEAWDAGIINVPFQ
jgi:hypothetical protein